MKRMPWMLSCLVFAVGQVSQTAFAFNPSISASYASLAGSGSNLTDKGLLSSAGNLPVSQISTAIQAETGIPDNNNFVKINTHQPLLTFNNSAMLETSNALNNSPDNASCRAGFVTESNYFSLDRGNILISPERDVVIGTQEGIVSIASGATIFVMESGNDTVIYDLYQAKPKQVSVVVNNHKLLMEPGCMLVLTKQKTKNFEDLAVNCHSISYRRAQEVDLPENSVNAFVANFSIFSALVRIQPLKQLVDSKDKRDQLLLHKLLKSAAMLRT